MLSPGEPRRFLARLRAPLVPSEAQRVERVLAAARVFLAFCSLIAISFDPTGPTRYEKLAYGLLVIYVVHSLLTLVLVNLRRESTPAFRLGVHAVDLLWPSLISLVTEGPGSPFYVYFFFVLLAAAYRWGFLETVATAGAAVLCLSVEMVLVGGGPRFFGRLLQGQSELNRFVMRSVYLFIVGYLLGYLGEEENTLRAETKAIARLIGKAQLGAGLRQTLQTVLEEVQQLFGAEGALLVLQEVATGRAFLWKPRRSDEAQGKSIDFSELGFSDRGKYFFPGPGHSWHANWPSRAGHKAKPGLFVMGSEGERLRDVSWSAPEEFLTPHSFRSLLATTFSFGEEWVGRLYLLDPALDASREGKLRFLQALVREVGPAVYSVYLLRRLRSRATAVERARVARELHDGIIQSLIGAEMQVDVLRRHAAQNPGHLGDQLAGLQKLLRQEVLNLRELMQQMRPLDLGPKQLLDYLADSVDKFRRETGISARFVCELEEAKLTPRTCTEVARILQEALVNVRKHSGAKNVLVRFGSQDGLWKLVIDDDGRGFDFSGHLSQAELDVARKGPLVIKERVRSIGGELAVESIPGRGARLEITFPQKAHG